MAGIGSSGYDITRLSNLVSNYVNYESASARAILSDMILDGADLVDALDNAKLDMERDSNEYEQLEEDHKELTNKLESLIKGKEGIFIDKIKNILQEYKVE
jgi:hypothetical protein